MGKDKKTKKGKQSEEFGEEEVETRKGSVDIEENEKPTRGKANKKKGGDADDDVTSDLKALSLDDKSSGDAKKGKGKKLQKSTEETNDINKSKGKKGKNEDVSDDESLSSQNKPEKKGKKQKGRKAREETDSEDESVKTEVSDDVKKGKKGKAKKEKPIETNKTTERKGKKGKAALDDEDSDNDVPVKSSGKGFKSGGFALLEVEDMDEDVDLGDSDGKESPVPMKSEDDEPEAPAVKKDDKGGKKGKKKKRRKDSDEEDIERQLEELALELEGKKPPEKPIEKPKAEESVVGDAETAEGESKKKKKKGKSAPQEEKAPVEKEEGEDEEGDDGTGVKTAAQKKKEKKERERQKKLAQNSQQKSQKSKEPVKAATEPVAEVSEKPETEEAKPEDDADAAEHAEGDESKKKKKKKKGEEEDKKDKKRPNKKAVAAMQEALKKLKEDEEKRRLEEEAKLKAEEEAENQRLEKLRLEQERKEKKKQKEKEKRERLKAEGKLLNKQQKQEKARVEATLEALRKQGFEVPAIGEKKERAPKPIDPRRLKRKKDEQQQQQAPAVEQVEIKINGPAETPVEEIKVEKEIKEEVIEEPKEEKVKESWEDEEDVKDAWDETSDEENEKTKQEKVVKEKVAKEKDPKSIEEESEDEDEDEESSDEDDESESESESEESEEERPKNEVTKEKIQARIQKRRDEAEKNRTLEKLRSPVVCVLGHVDTGKTKILDKIRHTHVQDAEAGGITQQIGATMVPKDVIKEQCKMVKNFANMEVNVPGLLIIDTPGHESFSNLRSRGSSLCDIAILVVDIMHGLEPQTIESLNMLKTKKTPFVVALNKIDRIYDWKSNKNKDVHDVIKSQPKNTKLEFDKLVKEVVLQFANQSMNVSLFYENKDYRSYVSMVPTSAVTGEGMGNLMSLIVELTQSMMAKRLAFSEDLQATVLEVKALPGLGTTIDVILVNGRLKEGDTVILAGHEGPLVTQIRSLLMPQPLKELRVKNPYQEFREVEGAQGVKIAAKELDKAIAGLQLVVAPHPDEVEILKEEVASTFMEAIKSINLSERGVYVQASTLGSLEALLEFLRSSKIPYAGIRIGPVVKKDVMKASIMLEHDSQYAVILAFDVKIERDAQELADSLGVKVFQADIIYHLFDMFTHYREDLIRKKKEELRHVAVFPCKLRILPQFIFNSRDPIVVGVSVEAGTVRVGTPITVPSRGFVDLGHVTTIESNHKPMSEAHKGQEVCIKIEPLGGEAPKMYERHFDYKDILVSRITRQSIDACKEYFRDELQNSDWKLIVELKKQLQIV